MELQNIKRTLAAGWALTVLVTGLAVGTNSVAATMLLLGGALVPPSLLLLLWNHPRQTMSESIQRARR